MNALTSGSFKASSRRYGVLAVGNKMMALNIHNLAEICVIQEVMPLLTGRSDVLGAIDLRGMMIPLLDPMMLCNADPMVEPPKLAAIVVYNGRMLALGVENAVSIAEYADSDIHGFYPTDRQPVVPVNGGLLAQDSTINVLEPASFFAHPDMPSLSVQDEAPRKAKSGTDKAHLIFEAGGASFGLDAIQISGTVPRKDVDVGSLSGGACLGTITHQRRRIPIMDATKVFGLGDTLRSTRPEFVIVHFPDERLLGFAVDVIQQIRMVKAHELSEVPDIFDQQGTLFSTVLTRKTAPQVFILDSDTIKAQPDLIRMSALSDRPKKPSRKTATSVGDSVKPKEDAEVWHVQQRCIVFTAGFQLCAKITDVVSILPTPEALTPVHMASATILGIFSHEERAVPLVSLTSALGGVPQNGSLLKRVLLVGPTTRRVGFLVDSVDGIETSEYLAKADGELRITDRIAKLKSATIRGVLPFADLEALAAQIVLPAK